MAGCDCYMLFLCILLCFPFGTASFWNYNLETIHMGVSVGGPSCVYHAVLPDAVPQFRFLEFGTHSGGWPDGVLHCSTFPYNCLLNPRTTPFFLGAIFCMSVVALWSPAPKPPKGSPPKGMVHRQQVAAAATALRSQSEPAHTLLPNPSPDRV